MMRVLLRDYFLQIAGFFKKIKPGIHIINSHYVTAELHDYHRDYKTFENFIQSLQKSMRFIKIEEAVEFLEGKNKTFKNPSIAFTFDDGFEECYTVIAPLLEKYGTRGAFFINANYIDSDKKYQEEFNKRTATFTKKPMSWDQIIDLHQRGHLIGSHNLDHTNFADLTKEELINQLKINKNILEEKLNYKCDYFAWTYGQMKHFPSEALLETQNFHKYIFSGTNYKHYHSLNGAVINRRHLEAFWNFSHVKYFLSFHKS